MAFIAFLTFFTLLAYAACVALDGNPTLLSVTALLYVGPINDDDDDVLQFVCRSRMCGACISRGSGTSSRWASASASNTRRN